ncbi:unnamed protein product [Dovyalis caffra]|uniref:Uncharacterized protein n=1 Tax=Dovyalis caffra TaxID=77055 RepID=A0AAV1RJX8_9ROSI|nr:unnamed protein product [Dovyalis caffra]
MINVISHELAELSSNPLVNAWYAGEDPISPTEIGDFCEGLYGTGGGGFDKATESSRVAVCREIIDLPSLTTALTALITEGEGVSDRGPVNLVGLFKATSS